MKRLYIAAYHQSKFGKLMDMTVPSIIREAVDGANWEQAGKDLNRIRQIIAINLPLGLIVVVVGASGRWWV